MQRFVAFLDILGFKGMVKQRNLDALIEIMNLFKSAIDMSNSLPTPTDPVLPISLVHYVAFSDSIVLYTDGVDSHDFFRIVHVMKILIGCSLGNKTPLRGSLAHGDFYADIENNIFAGKALVTAYENEGIQQWAGADICDDTVEFVLSKFPDVLNALKKYAYIAEYEIPFKSGINYTPKYGLAINWANTPLNAPLHLEQCIYSGYSFLSAEFDTLLDAIENHGAYAAENKDELTLQVNTKLLKPDVFEKWENTKKFYIYGKENGKCPFGLSPK